MNLTLRNKEIIFLLLGEDRYVTVRFIAEHINVSSRTVLRELNNIEKWLKNYNIRMEKRKGIGIRINLSGKERELLLNNIGSVKSDLIYTPEQRLTMLKAELMKKNTVTKLYTLARLLDVTEATIRSDLDKLEPWMKKYNLWVVKKPGLGIVLNGNESDIRSALISLIYEQFHEAELINLIFNEKEEINLDVVKARISQGILDIIDMRILESAQRQLRNIEKLMNIQFADNSYIALVIRISVTMHRCREGIFIENVDDTKADPKDKLYELVKEWFTFNENSLTDAVLDAEIRHMVIHIKGAEIQERFGLSDELSVEDQEILELTKEVIYIAERETGVYLEDNERLLRGLAGHLKMAVYRIKMHLDIMNPLLEDIKETYPDLFLTAVKCAEFIEESEQLSLPEDEIAYLATYIGAAIKEEKYNTYQMYRAVVVCTNDIGASQLLISEIEREFPNIKITSIISIMDMDMIELAQKHIDIIISTVELQITQLPLILVNPILNEEDKKNIRDVLENFLPESINYGRIKNAVLEEKLTGLKSYSDSILQIMRNFLFIEHVVVKDMDEWYRFISHTLTKRREDRMQIEKDLRLSEKKGAAILEPKGMILYHCHSKAVEELGMIIVRMKNPVKSADEFVKMMGTDTVIVLTIPYDADHFAMEILYEVTKKIINTDLTIVLKQQSKEDIMIELNTIYDNLIQKKAL